MLVTVNNVSTLSDNECVGGTTCTDPTLHKFDITGDIVVESALAAFPTPGLGTKGACLASVTGVVDYFFDYLLFPRTTAEIVTGGTSCPAAENTPALCADTMDNDGNGFKDCADNAVFALASCRTVTTISAIQATTLRPVASSLQGGP